MIYFYKPTPASISCARSKPMEVLEGQFVLPHICSLQTLSLNLPATHTYITNFTKDITNIQPSTFTVFPMHNIQNNLTYTFEDMNEVPYYMGFISLHTLETYVYPVGIMIIGIIICLGLVALFFVYIRRTYNELDNPPAYNQKYSKTNSNMPTHSTCT